MSLNCSFNIKVENITDIIGKDTFKNLTQEECESVITQLMSSYNLTQEALLDNKYKSDIINAIKRGREEVNKAALSSTKAGKAPKTNFKKGDTISIGDSNFTVSRVEKYSNYDVPIVYVKEPLQIRKGGFSPSLNVIILSAVVRASAYLKSISC